MHHKEKRTNNVNSSKTQSTDPDFVAVRFVIFERVERMENESKERMAMKKL